MWTLYLISYHVSCATSGSASAVKEPGHFEVKKSSSQVIRVHFFLKKSWRPFQLSPSKQRPPTPFHRQSKTNKAVRYGNVFIFFCSHYYRSKAIHRARQGEARAVDLPARSFDLGRPGVAPPLRPTQVEELLSRPEFKPRRWESSTRQRPTATRHCFFRILILPINIERLNVGPSATNFSAILTALVSVIGLGLTCTYRCFNKQHSF